MKAHKAQSVDVSCLHFFLCLILRCKPEDAQNKFASALLHLLIQFERLTISLFLTEGRSALPLATEGSQDCPRCEILYTRTLFIHLKVA